MIIKQIFTEPVWYFDSIEEENREQHCTEYTTDVYHLRWNLTRFGHNQNSTTTKKIVIYQKQT